ncbi:MAG: hypothetical protein FWE16_03525 [Firmicutes bacterium]|nr:hypothetical protein [Bacillota bacterium]
MKHHQAYKNRTAMLMRELGKKINGIYPEFLSDIVRQAAWEERDSNDQKLNEVLEMAKQFSIEDQKSMLYVNFPDGLSTLSEYHDVISQRLAKNEDISIPTKLKTFASNKINQVKALFHQK